MSDGWLDDSCGKLAAISAERLCSRAGSAFSTLGEVACRAQVSATLRALGGDLEAGETQALRAAIGALVEELAAVAVTYSDLRFYAHSVRDAVLDAAPDDATRVKAGGWFFEFAMVCTMHFAVHHEELLEQREAEREAFQLESQLAELQVALAEKTALLERIRQTSTPVVPVVEGILVVPLVGMFDTLRAELLTERLLHEIARTKSRSVILDISGVPVFDTGAANLVLRLMRVVRLLGSELFLVGVGPNTARTIVELEVDLTGVRALATLQDGLALALLSRRLQITAL